MEPSGGCWPSFRGLGSSDMAKRLKLVLNHAVSRDGGTDSGTRSGLKQGDQDDKWRRIRDRDLRGHRQETGRTQQT